MAKLQHSGLVVLGLLCSCQWVAGFDGASGCGCGWVGVCVCVYWNAQHAALARLLVSGTYVLCGD